MEGGMQVHGNSLRVFLFSFWETMLDGFEMGTGLYSYTDTLKVIKSEKNCHWPCRKNCLTSDFPLEVNFIIPTIWCPNGNQVTLNTAPRLSFVKESSPLLVDMGWKRLDHDPFNKVTCHVTGSQVHGFLCPLWVHRRSKLLSGKVLWTAVSDARFRFQGESKVLILIPAKTSGFHS